MTMLVLLCPHSYLTWELWVYFDEKLHILFTWQDYHPTWGLFLERPGKLSGPVITGSFEKQAPGDTRRTTRELPHVDSKLEAWRLKIVHDFHFLQSDMVFGIINLFSWIFDAVSTEKSCPTSILFLLTYIEIRIKECFPRTEPWLVNSNFRRSSRMQG